MILTHIIRFSFFNRSVNDVYNLVRDR